jgi:hypothetical protein
MMQFIGKMLSYVPLDKPTPRLRRGTQLRTGAEPRGAKTGIAYNGEEHLAQDRVKLPKPKSDWRRD